MKHREACEKVTHVVMDELMNYHKILVGKDGEMLADGKDVVEMCNSLINVAGALNAMVVGLSKHTADISGDTNFEAFVRSQIEITTSKAFIMDGMVTSKKVNTNANSH